MTEFETWVDSDDDDDELDTIGREDSPFQDLLPGEDEDDPLGTRIDEGTEDFVRWFQKRTGVSDPDPQRDATIWGSRHAVYPVDAVRRRRGEKKYVVYRLLPDARRPGHEDYVPKHDTEGDDDDDDDDDELSGLASLRPGWHGLVDLDSPNDPEMRALRLREARGWGRRVKGMLQTRYREAVWRSYQEVGRDRLSVLSTAASRVPDPRRHRVLIGSNGGGGGGDEQEALRLLKTFDVDTRLRDTARGILFVRRHPSTTKALKSAKQTASSHGSGRRHYAVYVGDILRRSSSKASQLQIGMVGREAKRDAWVKSTVDPKNVLLRPRVGRPTTTNTLHKAAAAKTRTTSIDLRTLPVFSSVHWSLTLPAAANKTPKLYRIGSTDVLLAKLLGLHTKVERRAVLDDATNFFARRFGVDMRGQQQQKHAKHATTTTNSKSGRLVNERVGAVMVAYRTTTTTTTKAYGPAAVHTAEGHLASDHHGPDGANTVRPANPGGDILGNGRVTYTNPSATTRVTEFGWMLRPTESKGLVLTDALADGSIVLMPRGEMLVTGFWVVQRPHAPPALLRFQSAGPSYTQAERLVGGGRGGSGTIQHVTTIDMDVYDMLHDAGRRPGQGVGRARTHIVRSSSSSSSDRIHVRTVVALRH